MTEITHEQIRDLLPDRLHSTLDDESRKLVEEHLHSCAECASEMRVLEMVKSAPSFAPIIDAVKVSSAILPYGGVPARKPQASSKVWQMALAAAVVAVIATTYVVGAGKISPAMPQAPQAVASTSTGAPAVPAAVTPAPAPTPKSAVKSNAPHELQVAVGLDDLSDGSIAQLSKELDGLDALPSAEPENLGVIDPTYGGEGGQ